VVLKRLLPRGPADRHTLRAGLSKSAMATRFGKAQPAELKMTARYVSTHGTVK
jgi:hypothetical protein